jgi:phosphoribosylanthranilate isomerase
MGSLLVKICGITRLEDALSAADSGADAVGFNFWRPGKRYVAPERAAEIAAALPPAIRRVGVFVDEDAATVLSIAAQVGLDTLQFHGAESPEYLNGIEHLVKWKVFRVTPGWNPAVLGGYAGVEAFLLDTAGATPGGTGQTFDWSLATAAKEWGKVILAGGLTPGNVAEAVRSVQPWGVDVASGVEDSPGVKNHALIREFVRAARGEVHTGDVREHT